MKYALSARHQTGEDVSAGHMTAASALAGLSTLKQQGASNILVFDVKTGRLVDEAALERADVQTRQTARLRPGP